MARPPVLARGAGLTRIFIGVSWPYANGPFHIGHLASTYVPADMFARFHRLRGDEVLMVSGSDVHGTPALVAAEKEGVSPEVLSRRFHEMNRSAFETLGITFDVFTTTHTVLHERTAQEVFLRLLENGLIARRTTEQPYCPKDRRFLPDRYLVGTCPHCGNERARGDECDRCGRPLEARQLGDPRCALCGTPARFDPTEHFFLRLDLLQPKVAEFIAERQHWRSGTRRVAENFLNEGLRATPITRDLDWGVPLPLEGYESKRLYVWFEAVIGYLSASKEWAVRAGRPEAWRRYWDAGEPARHYYFVGKDNKFHHTIVWPGMLLGVGGLHLPDDVAANEWLLIGGGKVSKSHSTEADAFHPALLARYPPDVIRFYSALLAPENHDTELDWDEIETVREELLANQFGNLVQRTLVLARDRMGGVIPAPGADWRSDDPQGPGPRLAAAHREITEAYEAIRLKLALDRTLEEVREANRRFHEAKPWQAAEPLRARAVYESIWRIHALATWLTPVLPGAAAEVYRMFGSPEPPGPGDWDRALEPPPAGRPLGEIRPLFPRAERKTPPPAASAGPHPSSGETTAPALSIRAGVIRAARDHPSADRLMVLEVDEGTPQPRTIVAGIRGAYSVDQLRGRPIVFLANLAARNLRGIPSRGMVLAGELDGRASLLRPPEGISPGALADGSGDAEATVSYDDFSRYRMTVGRVGAIDSGRASVDLGTRTVEVPGAWPAGTLVVVVEGPTSGDAPRLLAFGPGRAVAVVDQVPPGATVR